MPTAADMQLAAAVGSEGIFTRRCLKQYQKLINSSINCYFYIIMSVESSATNELGS